jgi:hypothetical protein
MLHLVGSFQQILAQAYRLLLATRPINVGEWQAKRDVPQARTYELEDVSFEIPVPSSRDVLAAMVKPNLPWAEEHFEERISGTPWNPPPSAAHWPFAQAGHAEHVDEQGRFSHTYPERLWPQARDASTALRFGIRYPYGDLNDVLELLRARPHTRQAYIPIWFPEDTGATHGQRVPCTLGYHVMNRGGQVKVVYYIRSCDVLRHLPDDVYMAARLLQWLCNQLSTDEQRVHPDRLLMHISSLHAFEGDRDILEYRRAKLERAR